MIPFYQTLIKDAEHEVRSNALTQFATLAKVCFERFESKEITLPLLHTIKELLTVDICNFRILLTTFATAWSES